MANDMFLSGVDLGTTATKAALYDPSARVVSEARAGVSLHYPQPGAVEQSIRIPTAEMAG